jgi:hypothetical protein
MPPARSRPRHHRCQSQEPQKQSSWVALVIRSLGMLLVPDSNCPLHGPGPLSHDKPIA